MQKYNVTFTENKKYPSTRKIEVQTDGVASAIMSVRRQFGNKVNIDNIAIAKDGADA